MCIERVASLERCKVVNQEPLFLQHFEFCTLLDMEAVHDTAVCELEAVAPETQYLVVRQREWRGIKGP